SAEPAPFNDYALSRDAAYCELPAACIFLDIKSDRYLLICGQQADWFRQVRGAASGHEISAEARKFAGILASKGILVPGRGDGKPIAPFRKCPPTGSVLEPPSAARRNATLPGMFRLLQSLAYCAALQRRPHIAACLAAVGRWKGQMEGRRPAPPERVAELARQFHAASPLFFSAQDACLFRSLLLLRYLTLRGAAPDLVFGVRLSPFLAHCWIQYRGIVLNDHLESAASFTPILAV
ncbi:MAG: lasso peptide biosynthesis B2 protein, partial [Alphaproteobacteria bacterium]|nr:lasso peptide biosynthesis B2 protein [Alphaproteobacteria bacterium]